MRWRGTGASSFDWMIGRAASSTSLDRPVPDVGMRPSLSADRQHPDAPAGQFARRFR